MKNLISKLSLTWRISLLIVGGAGLILGVVILYSHIAAKKMIFEKTSQRNQIMVEWITERIDLELRWTEAVVANAAKEIQEYDALTFAKAENVMIHAMNSQPGSFGMALAFPKDCLRPNMPDMCYGTRIHADQNQYRFGVRQNVAADYQADWFYLPYYLKHPVWVDPYYDNDVGKTMVTYAYPILDSEKNVTAVITCDLTADFIWQIIDKNQLGANGSCVIITADGFIIAHPDSKLTRKESIFSLSEHREYILGNASEDFWKLGQKMIKTDSGFVGYRRPHNKLQNWMHYKRVPSTGGSVGVFFSEQELIAEAVTLNHVNWIMGIAGIFLLSIFGVITGYSIARPLEKLSEVAGRLASGDFKVQIPQIRGSREVLRLGAAFIRMRSELQQYIKELTAATAAKEKIASELSIARDIQMSIVPKIFPPFPDHPKVDLYAKLDPALEVGGDLYDFAMLDNDRLYIAVGDVSGKGVPASILMAVGKTLLKASILSHEDPARAVTSTNNEISEHNDACMFITVFCGILNIHTGEFVYVNAGHNPPMIFRHDTRNIELLDICHGPAVGVLPNIKYPASRVTLSGNDLLLLYTDGITEAMNKDMKMYSDQRLSEFLLRHGDLSSAELIRKLYDDVHIYAAGMAQWDDMTTLAIRGCSEITPPSNPDTFELCLNNNLGDLNELLKWNDVICEKLNVPFSSAMKMRLIFEEWFVNVVKFGYPDSERVQHILVRLNRTSTALHAQIEDTGVFFDPTLSRMSAATEPVDHGLGLLFIQKNADELHYERRDGKNMLSITKKLDFNDVPLLEEPFFSENHPSTSLTRLFKNNVMIIGMPEEISSAGAIHIEHQLFNMITSGYLQLKCDFSKTRYISSAGLRVMLVTAKKVIAAKGSLVLTGLSPAVFEPFQLAGFTHIMDIHPRSV